MVKIVKNPGNGRFNNLNDPDRPQCVKMAGEHNARCQNTAVDGSNEAMH